MDDDGGSIWQSCSKLFVSFLTVGLTIIFIQPLFAIQKDQLKQLRQRLDAIVQEASPQAHVGVEVQSLKTGLRLYEKNNQRLFVPASSLKLITTAAALNLLGPDFRFETRVASDAPLENGIVKGNLYFVGGGDPSFSLSDMDALILELQLLELAEIEGDLIVDCSAFDEFAKGPGWMWDDVNGFSYSTVSALTINHSCLNLWVKPGLKQADPVRILSYPSTSTVQLLNRAETAGDALKLKVERPLVGDKAQIHIKGSLPLQASNQAYRIPIDQPHVYAGEILSQRLKEAGILLRGKIRTGTLPEQYQLLASMRSQPLNVLIQPILKNSDNLYSDQLFKKIGQQIAGGVGTWKSGSQTVRNFLEQQVGLNIHEMAILDGSGLSRYNQLSPHDFVHLLSWMYNQSPYSAELIAALPIGGGEGSLKERMQTLGPRVRAKSGTMTGISSLCGYVTTQSGEKLAFAIMMNGFVGAQLDAHEALEDKICLELSNL